MSSLKVTQDFIDQLITLLGKEKVSTAKAVCEEHGRDESYHPPKAPDLVAFPESTEDVSALVKLCAAHKIPVIPYGVGTSLEGHVAALNGGVSIDLSRMNKIVRVNAEDMDVVVQPGVTRRQLASYLRDTGLFFPVDPGADATLGGMAATRASGTTTVRYGAMRDNVLSMEVVMPDGRVVRTGSRARKSATGYDLTHLMVGSEGTLGVITELTLKLHGVPEAIAAAVCTFENLEGAVQTVISTIQMAAPVARIELLDARTMEAVNSYSNLDYEVGPTLFFEFHGTADGVAQTSEAVKALALENGGRGFQWSSEQEDRDRLWRARHDAYYASRAHYPGKEGYVGDVCVPISRLAMAIEQAQALLDKSPYPTFILGHVGDGNFHFLIFIDAEDPQEIADAQALSEQIVALGLELEGTCSGEHGVGHGKIKALEREYGDALDMMRAIKRGIDPDNIMNPGKIVHL